MIAAYIFKNNLMVAVIIILAGLVWGSFLNVVICRAKKGGSILWGRSKCPYCSKKISWYDNIPLVSFMLLRGRCRHCAKKISWQYPLVEAGTASLVVLAVWVNNLLVDYLVLYDIAGDWLMIAEYLWNIAYIFLVVGVLVVVFVYDWKYYLILDKFLLAGALVAFAGAILADWQTGILENYALELGLISGVREVAMPLLAGAVIRGLIGALIAGGFFFWIVWISRGKWMGWGDVKYALFMGFLLGFPVVLPGLFIAYLLGSIVGVTLVFANRKKMSSEIPFGPFLCVGTYIGLLFGDRIVYWYLTML